MEMRQKDLTAAIGNLNLSRYAEATTDTAFKQMLSPSLNDDRSVVISFLNSFIPAFRGTPVTSVNEMPVALPALLGKGEEKQTFMDLHVVMKMELITLLKCRPVGMSCSTNVRYFTRVVPMQDNYQQSSSVLGVGIMT
jgi:hypothetical protein